MAAPLFVQSAFATGDAGTGFTVTLPAPPTIGNLLIMYFAVRDSIGAVFAPPNGPWTLIARVATSAGDSWPTAMYARLAKAGDTAAFPVTGGGNGSKLDVTIAEFSSLGVGTDQVVTAGPGVGETTVLVTPTAGASIVIFAGVTERADGGPVPFTPAAGFTEISENAAVQGPQDAVCYRIIAPAAGSYTSGETYGGGNERAVIAAAFLAASGSVARGFDGGLGDTW